MIILDMDNCIADDEWRIPYIRWDLEGAARYHAYHILAPFDCLCNAHLFRHAIVSGLAVAIFTARPDAYRVSTEEWLRRNNVPYTVLYMRKEGCMQGSVALKSKFLRDLLAVAPFEEDGILAAYDDRQDVIDMYTRAGVEATRKWIHETPYGKDDR